MLTVGYQHVGANVVPLGKPPAPMGCHYKGAQASQWLRMCCAETRLGGIPLSALAVDGYCGTSNTGVVACTPLGVILRVDTASAGYCKRGLQSSLGSGCTFRK